MYNFADVERDILARGQFFKRIFASTEKVCAYRNFRAYATVAPGSVHAYARVRTYT
jgi:hypothetical protein